MHSYQTGLRCLNRNEDEDTDTEDNDAASKDDCYDPEFARISRMLRKTHEATRRFTISANDGSDPKNYDNSEDHYEGITYLDSVIQHLEDNNIEQKAITKLMNYLKDHRFDTESIDNDIGDGSSKGNISNYMQSNQQCLKFLISSINETKGIF